ncbi:unnamed protein product [Litomosoides sigmodontis]|uniref:C2H2-type domain-containing protein n=1 Tax=Litomosoides sigmodontis TaxID=42156 RepID=A0A3P6TYV8_LITSI|nr:unnamed protein product [Litomosoides sigmodontis]
MKRNEAIAVVQFTDHSNQQLERCCKSSLLPHSLVISILLRWRGSDVMQCDVIGELDLMVDKVLQSVMLLPYHLTLFVLPSCIAQVTVSPVGSLSVTFDSAYDKSGLANVDHVMNAAPNKELKCSECGKQFQKTFNLKRHKETHSNIKAYKCNKCGEKFGRLFTLKRHEKLHSGEKLYKCQLCHKEFKRAEHLNIHMRMHNGERNFKCDICNVAFVRSDPLAAHRRLHSNVKPFHCCQCGSNFSRKTHLVNHMKTHEGSIKKLYYVIAKSLVTPSVDDVLATDSLIKEIILHAGLSRDIVKA